MKKVVFNKIFELIKTFTLAFIISIFIRTAVAEARYVPSGSMIPTIMINDRVMIEKISTQVEDIKRGEILTFYPPFIEARDDSFKNRLFRRLGLKNDDSYIKRVIGLPGETVEIKNGLVLINGTSLNESYIKEKPYYSMPPVKVAKDELFMMGDNRNDSADSHVWGTLPLKNVTGHAVFKFWPPARAGKLN